MSKCKIRGIHTACGFKVDLNSFESYINVYVFQANDMGCHIITATNDILKKMELVGYNLTDYSLDTVKMFYNDAKASGYKV